MTRLYIKVSTTGVPFDAEVTDHNPPHTYPLEPPHPSPTTNSPKEVRDVLTPRWQEAMLKRQMFNG